MRAFAAGLALSFSLSVQAWSQPGHMVVAQIAWDIIEQKCPNLIPHLEALQKAVQSYVSKIGMDDRQVATFVQAATFMDTYRYTQGHSDTAQWHYINTPYIPDGQINYVTLESLNKAVSLAPNIEVQLAVSSGILSAARDDILDDKPPGDAACLAILEVEHFDGDEQQPLHNMELFNKDFPKGDNGGNSFKITGRSEEDELHALWDHMGDLFPPLSWEDSDCLQKVKTMAQTVVAFNKTYKPPIELVDLATRLDPWDHSYTLYMATKDVVYSGIDPNGPVSASYLKRVQEYSQFLVYTGGQVLAARLISILAPSTTGISAYTGIKLRDAQSHHNQHQISHLFSLCKTHDIGKHWIIQETLMQDDAAVCCCCCTPGLCKQFRQHVRRLMKKHQAGSFRQSWGGVLSLSGTVARSQKHRARAF
ncbi:S1/P1 nuclease [Spongorhabdus nitratireducens]